MPDYTPSAIVLGLNPVRSFIHANNVAAGWWMDARTGVDLRQEPFLTYAVPTKLMLTVSELAEAMEGHRRDTYDDKHPEFLSLHVEIVDAMVRLFDLAGVLNIDVERIMAAVLAKNLIRPDHQLGARRLPGGKKY